jgi:flagellar basal-body rod protein FlgF
MDNSIYVALSRQMTLFRDMETTANNIANVNTVGYNAEKLAFDDFLVDARIDGKIGQKVAFTRDPVSYRDTTNGSLKVTGNPLDLAISGPGYFMIETPLGTRYSKAGNFQIDANGTIVTPQGYPVLSQGGGAITLPDNATNLQVSDDGRISSGRDEIGQIGVVEFENEQAMKRMGNNLYSAEDQPQERRTARVVQGAIEQSNVQGVTELVRVVQLQRSLGSTAKFVEAMYDLQRKTSAAYSKSQQG